jgi:hypothetical protein
MVLFFGLGGAFPYLIQAFWRYGYGRYVLAAIAGVALIIGIVARRR